MNKQIQDAIQRKLYKTDPRILDHILKYAHHKDFLAASETATVEAGALKQKIQNSNTHRNFIENDDGSVTYVELFILIVTAG